MLQANLWRQSTTWRKPGCKVNVRLCVFGAERMLFESDYTFIPSGVRVGDNIATTRSMPIPQEGKDDSGKNAIKLLKLK
jgi:hypothetical protein